MDIAKELLVDPRVLAIVSPLLVTLSKALIGKTPKWLMPILSTVFGSILAALTGQDPATVGVLSGLAGVGIRETLDQAKKKVAG